MENISISELEQFLEDANKSTYANKEAPKTDPSRLKSEDYYFEKGNLIYHDTYFGGRDFIGGEIVYKDEKAVWGMNYYGYIVDSEALTNEVYDFLRQALMQPCTGIIPVRGPKEYAFEENRYINSPEGGLERFSGKEEIYFNGKLVYRADYHGGFIG